MTTQYRTMEKLIGVYTLIQIEEICWELKRSLVNNSIKIESKYYGILIKKTKDK